MIRRRMLMFAIAAALIPFQSPVFGGDESFVIIRNVVSPLDCSPYVLPEKEVPEMNIELKFTLETNSPFISTEREVLHDGLEYG